MIRRQRIMNQSGLVFWGYMCLVGLLIIAVVPAFAQDIVSTPNTTPPDSPETPLYAPLSIGQSVDGSITSEAFFDWWSVNLQEGDEIIIEMYASEGLEPLLGFLDINRDLIARSDTMRVEPANGIAVIQYEVQETGQYIIVPTRNGNENGTSTGRYRLETMLISQSIPQQELMPVEFRCGELVGNSALSIAFSEEAYEQLPNPEAPDEIVFEFFRLTVYGLDGFEPMIRVEADINPDAPLDCSDDAQRIAGNTLVLPDGTDLIYSEDDITTTAQLSLRNATTESQFGNIRFLIASKTGTQGRYVAVLEGLALQERNDVDYVDLRQGALARDNDLTIYMVGGNDTRLNPYMTLFDTRGEVLAVCNDAGQGGCLQTPTFAGYGTQIPLESGLLDLRADRFDAGVVLSDNSLDPFILELESNNGDTRGNYTLYFIGELGTSSE
jgi:hypothetical protein